MFQSRCLMQRQHKAIKGPGYSVRRIWTNHPKNTEKAHGQKKRGYHSLSLLLNLTTFGCCHILTKEIVFVCTEPEFRRLQLRILCRKESLHLEMQQFHICELFQSKIIHGILQHTGSKIAQTFLWRLNLCEQIIDLQEGLMH